MEIRRLGNSGLAVSAVGLGCNNFGMPHRPRPHPRGDPRRARRRHHPVRHRRPVRRIRDDASARSSQGQRDDVVLATKFGSDLARSGSRNGADWGARGSRRYIRTGRRVIAAPAAHRLDRPVPAAPTRPATPIEETLSALTDLVREGKVRYLGHSNFSGWQTAEAEWTARTRGHERFISAQNEYSWLDRAASSPTWCPALQHYGVGLLPFFPLASGLLTGKYRRGAAAPAGTRLAGGPMASRLASADFDVIEALEAFAARARRDACSTSRSAASRPSRQSHRSSPARRRPSRSRPTSRPARGGPRRTELARARPHHRLSGSGGGPTTANSQI